METIRAAQLEDAAAIARVHVDSWHTTYKGIIPGEFLATLSYARQEQSWQRILNDPAQVTFVTVDEAGTIVGFVNGGPEREGDPVYQAELYAIYVLQEAQRHGLGLRLVKDLTRLLAEHHFTSMMLWVLASNPACRFYEALGGQVIKQRQDQIGAAFYDELAYGWQDLSLNTRQVYVCRGAVPHPRATARARPISDKCIASEAATPPQGSPLRPTPLPPLPRRRAG